MRRANDNRLAEFCKFGNSQRVTVKNRIAGNASAATVEQAVTGFGGKHLLRPPLLVGEFEIHVLS